MKTYLINLDRRPDRLVEATKVLQSIGLNFTRINAVDGWQLQISSHINLLSRLYIKQSTLCPAVGCFLSHRKVWQDIVDNGIESALVLEDDISKADWDPNFLDLNPNDLGLDLIRVGVNSFKNNVTKETIKFAGPSIIGRKSSVETTVGTCVYIISNAGAKKCLKAKKIWFPVDQFFVWEELFGVKTVVISPLLFMPSGSQSDIKGSKSAVATKLTRTIVRKIVWQCLTIYGFLGRFLLFKCQQL